MKPNHVFWSVSSALLLFFASATEASGKTMYMYKGSPPSYGADPFTKGAQSYYLGPLLLQSGAPLSGEYPNYDLQPTAMRDTGDTKLYKLWWFCRFPSSPIPWAQTQDLPPYNLDATDRICYSWSSSPDGPWSPRKIVLKGLGGTAGNRGDDHLVGSPSVIRVDCSKTTCPPGMDANKRPYVMFYEAYGNYMTRVNSFTSTNGPPNKDIFVTGGDPSPPNDLTSSYTLNAEPLGYAPYLVKAGTRAIYSCEVRYTGGKVNRYLQMDTPCPERTDPYGVWRGLNKGSRYGQVVSIPVFWLYTADGPDRKKLFRCWDPANFDTFASTTVSAQNPDVSTCNGVPGAISEHSLGWVSIGWRSNGQLATDMVGALQNRIHMAYSLDGENWTRFVGAAPDGSGAVILPGDQTALVATPCSDVTEENYTIHSTYGAGYPSALVRTVSSVDYVEVFFTDKTDPTTNDDKLCSWKASSAEMRMHIPLQSLFDANAWISASQWANRGINAPYGGDIKWSKDANRYMALTLNPNEYGGDPSESAFVQAPILNWSYLNPPITGKLDIRVERASQTFNLDPVHPAPYQDIPPTNWGDSNTGRWGRYGAILGDENGQVLHFAGPGSSYYALHFYYEAINSGLGNVSFGMDLDHILILGYH